MTATQDFVEETTIIFWFRRDLRLHDNRGLYAAREHADHLYPVYLVDPSHNQWRHRCGDRLQWKLDAVASLRENIRDCGGELLVRTGFPEEVLPDLVDQLSADMVYWNRSYEPYERKRDQRTNDALAHKGIQVLTYKDQVLFEQREILTEQETAYQTFGYYKRKWKDRFKNLVVDPVFTFSSPEEIESGTIPAVEELDLERSLSDLQWEPSEAASRRRMNTFLDQHLAQYHEARDHPAKQATSGLSPYLRFGLLSPRELFWRVREWKQEEGSVEGPETFIEELIWRDFYHQVLYNYPHSATSNFKTGYETVPWETHPDWFIAWKEGKTGFPIVDAGMRQLNQTGWMHNRLRMIVAMFLTKQCMIHWKKGEKYFMNRLLDGDTAANNGGWQWCASTGTDAAPYFRVFNPVTQSQKYDPEGEFIRRFCPELADLPDKNIHAPFQADAEIMEEAGVELGKDYPKPILDHRARREHAIEAFRSATQNGSSSSQ